MPKDTAISVCLNVSAPLGIHLVHRHLITFAGEFARKMCTV